MHLQYCIKVLQIKKVSLTKFVVAHHFENDRGTEFYRFQEVDSGKMVEGRFLRKELFALKNNV